jgi:four helix bundle protein
MMNDERGARSTAEFISKMESACQELDETAYRLEITECASILPKARLGDIRQETDELIAIFTRITLASKQRK